MTLYVGAMSGTSLDGVDAVLADIDDETRQPRATLGHVHLAMPPALHGELLALNSPSGSDEMHRSALAANAVAALYAAAVDELLRRTGTAAQRVAAIGAHGQTVRHRPGGFDGTGYTLQLLNGALLAERTGIDVVCDLRSADVVAGGQGAPLVPAFHAACFGGGATSVVLNVGGIANITVLPADGTVTGFDCGPGNVLMDLWCREHLGVAYDDEGRIAARGRVLAQLLSRMLAEPYLALPPPKSTGRDLFREDWLRSHLPPGHGCAAPDVLATLCELTATAAVQAVRGHAAGAQELLVCGGGAANRHLMQCLARLLPGVAVRTTASRGVAPDQVEAYAFAWLAACRLHRVPAALPAVTGARGARVLGAWYAAPPRSSAARS